MPRLNAGQPIVFPDGTMQAPFRDYLLRLDAHGLAVSWSGVTGTPTTLAGYGITDAYTQATIDSALSGKSSIGHTHDSAYLKLSGGVVTGQITINSTDCSDGLYGNYTIAALGEIKHIWSIGNAYRVDASGLNFGNLFGAAYYHPLNGAGDYGGDHQFVWCNGGNPLVALGTNLWAQGNVISASDIRYKTDIEPIKDALDKVAQLTGYNFTMDNTRRTGLIAQEVQKVLPEAVVGDDYLSVAYGNMVGLLVNAINDLRAEVEELKNGIT